MNNFTKKIKKFWIEKNINKIIKKIFISLGLLLITPLYLLVLIFACSIFLMAVMIINIIGLFSERVFNFLEENELDVIKRNNI